MTLRDGHGAPSSGQALHASAVATLTVWPAPSPTQAEHRARFLAHLAAHEDGLAK